MAWTRISVTRLGTHSSVRFMKLTIYRNPFFIHSVRLREHASVVSTHLKIVVCAIDNVFHGVLTKTVRTLYRDHNTRSSVMIRRSIARRANGNDRFRRSPRDSGLTVYNVPGSAIQNDLNRCKFYSNRAV